MIVSELRSAFRTLLQRQPFTCVSVLLLALGVGATTVLFALADAVMFRPFPFADQDRLVIGAENRAGWTRAEVSYASFRDWRARSIAFDGLAAIGSSNWTTTLHGSDPIMVASGGFGYRARRLMVAFEIAVAVVVLTGAGLLYRSVSRLGHLDLGFNPERLLAVEVGLPPTIANGTRADVFQFYSRAIDAVTDVPFVQAIAAVAGRPLKGPIGLDSSWQIEGQSHAVAEHNPWVNLETITPTYFATMGTRVTEGRAFDVHDRASAEPVVIVNEKLARWAWPGQSAIGKRIRAAGLDVGRSPAPWWTIVGVVADIRYREIASAPFDVYVAFQQSWFAVGDLMIRTSAPPASVAPAVRARLRQISPDGIIDVASMDQVVAAHEAPWKANLFFFALFAGLTMLLAVVGLYAMLASSVAEQWREIGVRRALGASDRRIVRDVFMEGTRVAIPGALAGTVACVLTSRFMGALLFEVRPLDPLTLIGVAIGVLTVTSIACAFPAWRAARVDPAVCLRAE
jgi:putative ABC transport system permease protein